MRDRLVTQCPTRLVVAGMLAGDPHQGGAIWATLQWVLGLRDLGHAVTVVDELPDGAAITPAVTASLRATATAFDLCGSAAVFTEPVSDVIGMSSAALRHTLARADVLVNLSGRLRSLDLVGATPIRVFVDLDPGFVQLWHAEGHDLGLQHHSHAATVGQAIGTPTCDLPTLGVDWIHVMPPVVLAHWPCVPLPSHSTPRLTTTANWRSYGNVTWRGVSLGQKAHSTRTLAALPARSALPLEIALQIHPGDGADRAALDRAGWLLVDPLAMAGTPQRYHSYITASSGEIGIAKHGYVCARTGWVSDRSAAYAASGRPLVLQDTGDHGLHDRPGVLTFCDVDSAVEAVQRLRADHRRHATGARDVAEECFDSRRVLGGLLERVAE